MANPYDCVIVGGGPAGLSAAVYVARYCRSAVVIDKGYGRSTTPEVNENYLGFPDGVPAEELRQLGRRQGERFGARFVDANVTDVQRVDGAFDVVAPEETHRGRTVILATGVSDIFPEFEGMHDYVGRTLFWCITCDGYKVRGGRVVVVGRNDEAATTALQLQNFTPNVIFVTNCTPEECALTERRRRYLRDAAIPVHESSISHVEGADGRLERVDLDDGTSVEADFMFNQQGSKPNSALGVKLGLDMNEDGYIHCDEEQRTNVPLVYAAGDVTRIFAHQIVTAAHEGATAAQAANYDLYRPEQREG